MKLDLKKLKIGETATSRSDIKKGGHLQMIKSSEELAKFVRKERKRQKITQAQLAAFANLSRLAVIEFEKLKSDVQLSTLLKILSACNLDLEIRVKNE